MNNFKKVAEEIVSNRFNTDKSDLKFILSKGDICEIISGAKYIREYFFGKKIHLCSILNTKSGACPEDCKYCAQSIHYNVDIIKYPFLDSSEIKRFVDKNEDTKIHRLSFVTSGKKLSKKEIDKLCDAILTTSSKKRFCASLGILDEDDLIKLKKAGVSRYHHNLETSRSFYPNICTTHSYDERVKTVKMAKKLGFSVCCGGIFGMGESDMDILELAQTLEELDVDVIPVNFLNPIKGTPFENYNFLTPEKCLRIISFLRFYFPSKDILVCGGRIENLKNYHSKIFDAGANGIMTGDYLTRKGRTYNEDTQMIQELGLEVC